MLFSDSLLEQTLLGDVKTCKAGVLSDPEDTGLVEQGGIVLLGGIDADEGDGVAAGRHVERGGCVGGVAGAGGGDGARHRAVHQHLDLLVADAFVAPLGGADADQVGAGRREIHHLADRAGRLEEGDLATLWGVGVAGGEAAAVARQAGRAAEAPRRARRIILVGRRARPLARVLKTGVSTPYRGETLLMLT